tara:strand:- start:2 stop:148 length:147 start_codon:yes stop_codon:yes gene_type:complete
VAKEEQIDTPVFAACMSSGIFGVAVPLVLKHKYVSIACTFISPQAPNI